MLRWKSFCRGTFRKSVLHKHWALHLCVRVDFFLQRLQLFGNSLLVTGVGVLCDKVFDDFFYIQLIDATALAVLVKEALCEGLAQLLFLGIFISFLDEVLAGL